MQTSQYGFVLYHYSGFKQKKEQLFPWKLFSFMYATNIFILFEVRCKRVNARKDVSMITNQFLHFINQKERHMQISMCPVKKCFMYKGEYPFTGAHTFIQRNFFPFTDAKKELLKRNNGKRHNHRYKRDVMSKRNKLQYQNVLLGGPLKNANTFGHCSFMDPKIHGSIVDKELATYASLSDAKDRELHLVYGLSSLDPCTVKTIRWLDRHHMVIRDCQRIIYDEEIKLATAVDIICTDKRNGELIVVELKTTNHSSADWYEKPLNECYFKGRFCQLPFSMMWIDQLQLFLMVSALKRLYGVPIKRRNAFVLRVGPDRIWRYNLKIPV